jgi:hypothetical protein
MKGLYISPYQNTNRIDELKQTIAKKKNKIATNQQKMENHFKRKCQSNWSYLQEFVTYKENWNKKHSIPAENLAGHYAESQDSFIKEAIERYKKEAIHTEALKPDFIITPAQKNGHDTEIKELFTQT